MTDTPKKPKPQQIRLEMPPSLTAVYANLVMIAHTASEVVLDFAHWMPNLPLARVQSRVALTPTNAKLLYKALGENLEKYEKQFGEIKTPPTLADQLFSLVKPAGATGAGDNLVGGADDHLPEGDEPPEDDKG